MKLEYPSLFQPGKVEVWFCDALCCSGQQIHRDDGPAVIYPDGTQEWWQHGRKLTDTEASGLRHRLIEQAVLHAITKPTVAPEKAAFKKKG